MACMGLFCATSNTEGRPLWARLPSQRNSKHDKNIKTKAPQDCIFALCLSTMSFHACSTL